MFSRKSKIVIRDGKLTAKNTSPSQLLSALTDAQLYAVLRFAEGEDYVGAMDKIKAVLDRRLEAALRGKAKITDKSKLKVGYGVLLYDIVADIGGLR